MSNTVSSGSSGSMTQNSKGSSGSEHQQENAPVGFRSVLRLRPLFKKERDEQIVLEETSSRTVVLHPPPPRPDEIVSPSSALVAQTLHQARTEQDVEFSFDTVFSPTASQDKVYIALGHSMAQSLMEPLKTVEPESIPRKTNLLITMGHTDAGKSYSCWGDGIVSRRKTAGDGLVPRLIDSLFIQSKHHVSCKRKYSFAVKSSFLQVDQSKSKPTQSQIRDLLQPVVRRIISIPQTGIGGSPSPMNGIKSPGTRPHKTESGFGTKSSGSYSSLDEPVSLEQDPDSSDLMLVNGQVRACSTAEEARLSLQTAMNNRRKLKNKRKDSHFFVQLQPVLVDRSGRTVLEGDRIAVLDMASLDSQQVSSKKSLSGSRIKDAMPSRMDAHAAVLHCLQSIRKNQDMLVNEEFNNCSSKVHRRPSLIKVPFLRHKVTMLLQPLFSAHYTDYTIVTLFLASHPGHSDHGEKKELLQQLQLLHRPLPSRGAVTGIQPLQILRKRGKAKTTRAEKPIGHAWDADDEKSVSNAKRNRRLSKDRVYPLVPQPGLSMERSSSMSYSESSVEDDCDIVPLPPPVAPGYRASFASTAPTISLPD